MPQVISAAPSFDVSPLATRLAGSGKVIADPARELCKRYGYQTLYEIPAVLQKQVRRELIRTHAEQLGKDPSGVFDHSAVSYTHLTLPTIYSV